jgi:hypothetical protein
MVGFCYVMAEIRFDFWVDRRRFETSIGHGQLVVIFGF